MTQILADTKLSPLVLHTRPALEMSDTQFFEFCQLNRDLRIEQSAEGDLIIMAPTGGETGDRNAELTTQCRLWAKKDGACVAFDCSTGVILRHVAQRSPDASWVVRSRLAALTPEQKQRFLPLCPDFVVELRSPSDSLTDAQEKMREYMDNGARLGWLIDPVERRVHVHRPGVAVDVLNEANTISGDPELPGFVLQLQDIWTPSF